VKASSIGENVNEMSENGEKSLMKLAARNASA